MGVGLVAIILVCCPAWWRGRTMAAAEVARTRMCQNCMFAVVDVVYGCFIGVWK